MQNINTVIIKKKNVKKKILKVVMVKRNVCVGFSLLIWIVMVVSDSKDHKMSACEKDWGCILKL